MRAHKHYLIFVLFFFLVSGCTQLNYRPKVVLGSSTLGAGVGTLIGGFSAKGSGNSDVGSIIGAVSGSMLGALIGYLVSKKSAAPEVVALHPVEKPKPAPPVREVAKAPIPVKPEPTPPRVVVSRDQPKLETIIVLDQLFFDFDKTIIKPGGRAILDRLVSFLRENPDWKVNLEGHADWIGTVRYNHRLSEKRALSVRNYLVGKGMDPDRIATRGFGETNPKSDNKTRGGRAKNRRVEVKVH